MGCNFYVKLNECEKCKRYDEIHLGKSSYGWQFSFQYNDGKYYKNVEEMKEWLKDKHIFNDCDEKITHKEFWKMVKSKMSGFNHSDKVEDINSWNIDGYSFTNCYFC